MKRVIYLKSRSKEWMSGWVEMIGCYVGIRYFDSKVWFKSLGHQFFKPHQISRWRGSRDRSDTLGVPFQIQIINTHPINQKKVWWVVRLDGIWRWKSEIGLRTDRRPKPVRPIWTWSTKKFINFTGSRSFGNWINPTTNKPRGVEIQNWGPIKSQSSYILDWFGLEVYIKACVRR